MEGEVFLVDDLETNEMERSARTKKRRKEDASRRREGERETNLVKSIQACRDQRHPVPYQSPLVLLLSS